MAGRIDNEARHDASKALHTLFIISISLGSLCLLIRLVLRQSAVYNIQRCMIIFLALGSLLFSLFSLVVTVISEFDQLASMSCRTSVMATVYAFFFFPFVYAMGLLAIGVDLYLAVSRHFTPSPLLRFAFIAFPWMLGLVVVLPLTMAGINWDHGCYARFTLERDRAQVWVCCLIPAIAVLAAGILLAAIVRQRNQATRSNVQSTGQHFSSPAQYQASYNTGSQGGIVITSPTKRPDSSHYQTYDYQGGSAPPPQYQSYAHPQYQHQHPYQPSAPPLQQHQQAYYPPPPNYAPPPPGFGPPCYEYNHNAAPHQAAPSPVVQQTARAAPESTTTYRDVKNDAKALLVASLIFFACSFPYAVYNLGYAMNEYADRMDVFTQTVVGDTIYWFTILRWLLLCISWFVFIK